MNQSTNEELQDLIKKATAGDKTSLETVMRSVQDLVFNLSLRMLGTFPDAEDASQDILLKVITHLSSFKGKSSFSTWVFRIAVNHLKDYKKHMFAQYPLSFEFYGDDIQNARTENIPDMTQNVEQAILAEELKLSCTNVMLQCLDTESRCIFILGTMFQVDSRIAGDILGITPEAYRKRLSRVRKKMAEFLTEYCGEYGNGKCRCADRVNYAIKSRRITPSQLCFQTAAPASITLDVKKAMEEIDDLAQQFSFCKTYQSPESLTFKLVRDTRFSHDKSPYNPAFRAHIGPEGKLPVPVGYYLMIKPGGQSFLGGGLFADMFKDATAMIRTYIAANGEEWEKILHAPAFQKVFTVQGTALKNVPAGYDKSHPQAEFLKFKSWYLEYPVSDDIIADGELFLTEAVRLFRIMKPFNDFLNRALEGFQMPVR